MITLTDNAASKVAQLLESEGAAEMALRVAVKSGGCSGYSYDMYFDSEIASDDITLTFGSVRVVVDPASAPMLRCKLGLQRRSQRGRLCNHQPKRTALMRLR